MNNEVEDTVEKQFNDLGQEGWELMSAVNLDSGADSLMEVTNVIEYIFKRNMT